MGYRKVPIIYTLELGGEYKGLVVRMRSMQIGEMRRIVRVMEDDSASTGDVLDKMLAQIVKGLVSWNLEDENGVPIEPTSAAVDELEYELVQELMTSWLSHVSGPSEELGKDSLSGGSFPGQPLTMETL